MLASDALTDFTVKNGLVVRYHKPEVKPEAVQDGVLVIKGRDGKLRSATAVGGILLEGTGWVPQSGMLRGRTPVMVAPEETWLRPKARIEEEVIYGGLWFQHFGHFITESTTRLWYAKRHPELPVLWLRGVNGELHPAAGPTWRADLLDMLGVANRHMLVRRPTLVDTIRIPEPGHVLGVSLAPEQVDFLGVGLPKADTGKIWLSRASLDPTKSEVIDGETAVEAVLARAGWTIFTPERHPIRHQIEVLAGATHIAGFMGSGLHLLLFVKNVAAKVTIFSKGEPRTVNYDVIAAAKRFEQEIVPVPIRNGRVGHVGVSVLENPRSVLDHLLR